MWTTAWQLLTRTVKLPPGAPILVVGASGSAGRALVLLAVHLGLRVIGTCSAKNIAIVEEMGATAIDYHQADLPDRIRAASGGEGVLAAFDAIGGDSWKTSWRSLATAGTLIGYGMQDFLDSGASLPIEAIRNLFRLKISWPVSARFDRSRRKTLFYNIQERRSSHPADFRADVLHLLDLIALGTLTPAPPETLPLSQAAEAHRRIDAGDVRHRLVLLP
jgi:NADPH:quinone reductase-like Zn-dependent oxidoreductase